MAAFSPSDRLWRDGDPLLNHAPHSRLGALVVIATLV